MSTSSLDRTTQHGHARSSLLSSHTAAQRPSQQVVLQNEGILVASRERAVSRGGERESKMSGLRNFLHATYKSAAEKVLPPLANSAFEEKGVRV